MTSAGPNSAGQKSAGQKSAVQKSAGRASASQTSAGITGIHHTGIIVRDLDRSIYFYHDLLGATFVSEPSPWFDGPELARGVGVPGARLRQVNLSFGGATLELLEYAGRPASDTQPAPQNRLGSMHVGLRVADIVATKAHLEAEGVHFLSDVNVVDEGTLAGWRWVYFHDPDGITLELVEEAYRKPHEAAIAAYLAGRPSLESLE
jgi:catechol 2,3-dioxygenase-like lactoylglutathione lyase family enzyme